MSAIPSRTLTHFSVLPPQVLLIAVALLCCILPLFYIMLNMLSNEIIFQYLMADGANPGWTTGRGSVALFNSVFEISPNGIWLLQCGFFNSQSTLWNNRYLVTQLYLIFVWFLNSFGMRSVITICTISLSNLSNLSNLKYLACGSSVLKFVNPVRYVIEYLRVLSVFRF